MTIIYQRLLRRRPRVGAVSWATVRASCWRSLRSVPLWKLLLAASGWITLLGVLILPDGSLPRVVLVFGFVLACPGLAVSGLLPIREPLERWVLAIALSMSTALLVTVALTVLRIESITLRLALLAAITTVGTFIDIGLSFRGGAVAVTRHRTVRP